MKAAPPPIDALLRSAWFGIAARIALTAPFWLSAADKLLHPSAALSEARHFGLHPAAMTVAAVIAVQAIGSLLIVLGRAVWLGAGALGVFTAAATLIGHAFWTLEDAGARFHDRNSFFEHLGLIGGLMLAAALAERER